MKKEFRVWIKDEQKYKYIDDLYWFEENFVGQMIDDSVYIFEQLIGIKDNKEIEIYEGDIFWFEYIKELNINISLIGVFIWNEDELRYEIDIKENEENYTCLSYINNGTMFNFEVIGNIHKNPELLK